MAATAISSGTEEPKPAMITSESILLGIEMSVSSDAAERLVEPAARDRRQQPQHRAEPHAISVATSATPMVYGVPCDDAHQHVAAQVVGAEPVLRADRLEHAGVATSRRVRRQEGRDKRDGGPERRSRPSRACRQRQTAACGATSGGLRRRRRPRGRSSAGGAHWCRSLGLATMPHMSAISTRIR